MSRHSRILLLILACGLALRLVYGLAQDPLAPYVVSGGDTTWYLANAYALVTDAPFGTVINGHVTAISTLDQPPVFFLLVGLPQVWFTPAGAIIVIRVLLAFMSAATCFFAYRMAYLLIAARNSRGDPAGRPYPDKTRSHLAGLIAAAALAFSPVFFMEAADIKTETTYIFFLAAGIWLFLETLAREQRRGWLLLFSGVMLGLATLTRAVFLLFPLALVVYLLILGFGWRRAALLLLVYAITVSTWTIYNRVHWNRWVIAGAGLDSFLYLGATGWDSPQEVDQRLMATQATSAPAEQPASTTLEATSEAAEAAAQPLPEATTQATPQPRLDYASGAQNAILSDIPGWIRRRVSELAAAYLQPHGTLFFPGESLREIALKWLRNDRSISGLAALTQGASLREFALNWSRNDHSVSGMAALIQGESFWPKLLVYVLHYSALLFGLVGMWRTRHNWRLALPMIGFIAYTTLIHLVLLALPRYIFPMMVFWWVFAAAGIVGLKKRSTEY